VRILVVNPGSSSLKLGLLDGEDQTLLDREHDGTGGRIDREALEATVREAGVVDAVGLRFVHGGARYSGPVLIDAEAAAYLATLIDLAPLHQGPALEAYEALRRLLPQTPVVACFDTAFHHDLPAAAKTYPIPAEWRERWAIRRYGFHGLSHAYASRRAAELLGRPLSELRTVTCHLGSGASLAAVEGGRSVDTTMGFTPLDGLVMATRSGSLDPGLVLWLVIHGGLSAEEVLDGLDRRSGLLALGASRDLREVLAGPDRELALGVYTHRLRALIAAMAAAMGGLDALVFTGGVGEHSAAVRAGVAEGLGFLGVAVDSAVNAASGDREISAGGAAVRTVVVSAREDLEISRQVRELLG